MAVSKIELEGGGEGEELIASDLRLYVLASTTLSHSTADDLNRQTQSTFTNFN
jgi:hypothetical protein